MYKRDSSSNDMGDLPSQEQELDQEEGAPFKSLYQMRSREKTQHHSRTSSPNDRGLGKSSSQQQPALGAGGSGSQKNGETSRIRRGPVLLRRTLSSLSMGGGSGAGYGEELSRSVSPAAAAGGPQTRRKRHSLRGSVGGNPDDTGGSDSRQGHVLPQAPSRKRSFAGALFKKLAGSGLQAAETGSHPHFNPDEIDAISSVRVDSGRRSSRDSGQSQHESVPSSLRRKVSNLVHGIGHEIEGHSTNGSSVTGLNMAPIKKSVTLSEDHRKQEGDRPNLARHKTIHLLIPPGSSPSSPRSSTASTTSSVISGTLKDEPALKRYFQLDTNLDNVSDITKLPDSGSHLAVGAKDESSVPQSTLKTALDRKVPRKSHSTADLTLSATSSRTGTKENSPKVKARQWVAPESWDVESNVERPRAKKYSYGEMAANHRRKKAHPHPLNSQEGSQHPEQQHHHQQQERPEEDHYQHEQFKNRAAELSTYIPRNDSISPNGLHRTFAASSMDEDGVTGAKESSQDVYSTTDNEELESSISESSTSASDYASSHTESFTTNENNRYNDSVSILAMTTTPMETKDELSVNKEVSLVDEKHDKVEYELEKYYKDCSDLEPKRHYAIRIFNTDDTFTTLSCTPKTTVKEIIPALKRKFNITSQGRYQLSLKVGKLSKILRPLAKPIIIERKLLLLNGYRKTDPLHIMGIEDLSFVFKFLFHPVAPSHLTTDQEQRLMRSDFIHVDLRGMDLTTPPIIFYQHTADIESLDVSNNADIFLPLEFIESTIKLTSLRMVNIRASRFPANVTEADKLVSLELQRNFIRKVPNSIFKLSNLTILNLQCNELDRLPKGFGQLKNLQLLDLSSNRFVHYPEILNECTNLLQINLSYNKISSLPKSTNRLIKLAKMNLSHNKLTEINDLSGMKNLRTLNLQHNRIGSIKTCASNLQNLFLTDNRISSFNDVLPKLRALEIEENPMTSISYKDYYPMSMTSLSLSKAKLASVPAELFIKLSRLEKLDLSQNNLTQLPEEISLLNRLVYLSVARNKLESLPVGFSKLTSLKTLDLHSNNLRDLVDGIQDLELTSFNISSNMLSNSILSTPFYQNISCDSKLTKTLMFFLAADNQFDDQTWAFVNCFTNLKLLNLSYNNFQDISSLKLENLLDLYFSGNKISTLSGDVVLKWKSLKTLMLNGNHLLSLPAELSQLSHLNVFDVGCNQLKYNISNYHYEWNWRVNKELKYLNLSGNKRFDIKSFYCQEINADLSDLTLLPNLKVLGLMDVTLNTSKVPDENFNLRMRTTGSMLNGMRYGVADTLGQRDFVSSRDVTFERFNGKDDESLICLHDGKNQNATYGHTISKLVRDIYDKILVRQLEKYGDSDDGVKKALRFSFLQLNKEINVMLGSVDSGANVANLTSADLLSGACSTAVYIKGNKVFTANIGDCMAILSKNNGDYQRLTKLHVPYKRAEYERIRLSGGYVNDDKLDGVVDVSRAVGFFDLLPHIHASPDISLVNLTKADEMLIISTNKLWDYMDYETACDIARENSADPMLAAAAMKDHAIAYGCPDNLTILCLAFDKSAEQQSRFSLNKSSFMRRSTFEDTTLRRLQPEILPPTGNLAIVFTDIKNSTFLWELFPNAMRTAIKTHNDIMRRLLRIYGGYEVKTEGDAFMVAFPTPISSLVWCLSVQLKLLDAQWPEEITSIQDGCAIYEKHGTKIYQGLCVRMGVHWGCPVPELDLVTQRMDYLGPMVNKAARVEGVADGGQITLSSDFCMELNKIMKIHERVVKDKEPLKDVYGDEFVGVVLEKEIAMLDSIGYVFFDHGEQKLKGLETKELITICYPKSLQSRHNFVSEDEQTKVLNEKCLMRLRTISRRLENVVSAVSRGNTEVESRTRNEKMSSIDENAKNSIAVGGSESETLAFFGHLLTRVESYVAILKLQQTMCHGLDCYKSGDANSKQMTVFELLDEVLSKINGQSS